jgi:NTE family protein
MDQKRKLGLVLGGGGGKCFVHLPLLQRISDEGIRVDHIGAASTGTIIAGLWVSGYSPEQIVKMFTNKKTPSQWFGFTIKRHGFVNGEKMYSFLKARLGARTLENMDIPCTFTILNATTGEYIEEEKAELARSIVNSCAFPGILAAKKQNGQILVDGGIVNAAPADICRKKVGPDGVVITSFCQGYFEPSQKAVSNPAKLLYRSVSLALEYHKRKITQANSDIVIDQLPNIPINISSLVKYTADMFDHNKISYYLRTGKQNVDRHWPEIKRLLSS